METTFEAPGPGPWQQDSAHVPGGWSRLVSDIYPEGAMKGFAETFARWGALLDTLGWAMVNSFPYHQPRPFDLPGPDGPPSPEFVHAEIERRTAVAAQAFADRIWRDVIEQWDTELKPAAIARHRELSDVDVAALDDESLRSHVHACLEHVRAMSYQHHRFNGSALVPVADFVRHASEWTGRPPMPLFAVFDGYSPVSGVLCPEIGPALDAIRADAQAAAVLHSEGDATQVLGQLRERLAEVDEFVRSVGFRLLEGFDLTGPTAIERPDTIVGRLRAALETDPEAPRRRADDAAAELREAVPAEHRNEFDELLAEARLVYRLRDERGLYSDITAFGILRLALLEAARRLVDEGELEEPEHIFEMTQAELEAKLAGNEAPSAAELAARATQRQEISRQGAPRYLGDPPPPPPPIDQLPPPLARVMAALGMAIEGILGQMEQPTGDDETIIGIPASAGVYEGRVHLVVEFDDLFDIEDGDVLVTPATGEAFNAMLHLVGAIVTDHGSFASHAGIVAREAGFPAVVGCVNATKRVRQGQRVRVDGTSGEVHVL